MKFAFDANFAYSSLAPKMDVTGGSRTFSNELPCRSYELFITVSYVSQRTDVPDVVRRVLGGDRSVEVENNIRQSLALWDETSDPVLTCVRYVSVGKNTQTELLDEHRTYLGLVAAWGCLTEEEVDKINIEVARTYLNL